jgi:hypothetical protein
MLPSCLGMFILNGRIDYTPCLVPDSLKVQAFVIKIGFAYLKRWIETKTAVTHPPE